MEPLGIRVLIVEPGAFRTDFAGRSLRGGQTRIADYDKTAGPRRKENDRTDGAQPGDPARAAKVLLDVLAKPQLPVRVLLGSDAVQIVGTEIERQLEEIRSWADVSASTDFASSD